MGKNNKISDLSHTTSTHYAAEYRIIKFDLVKVVILNVVYLAAILTLYYTNKNTHYLENWFAKLLHF